MNFEKKNIKVILLIVAVAVLLYVGLQNMNVVFDFLGGLLATLTPFIIALCLSFYMNILMKGIEKRLFRPRSGKPVSTAKEKLRRPLAILSTFVIVVGIIVALLLVVVPQLIESITQIGNNIPAVVQNVQNWLTSFAAEHEEFQEYINGLEIDWPSITSALTDFVSNDLMNVVNSTFSFVTNLIGTIVNVFLGILLAIYMLAKKEYLIERTKRIMYAFMPAKTVSSIISVASITNKTFYNFIRGQMVECVILTSLTLLGLSIFQFPYAVLIAACVAVLSWVPMFGVAIATAIGAFFIFTENPVQTIWFVVFMICLQQFEGNLIYPRVVGSKIGLPPIFVVSAITLFGNLFGFVGLLVGVPLMCVIYTILRGVVYVRLKERKIPKERYECRGDDYEFEKERRRIHREHLRQKRDSEKDGKKTKVHKLKLNKK